MKRRTAASHSAGGVIYPSGSAGARRSITARVINPLRMAASQQAHMEQRVEVTAAAAAAAAAICCSGFLQFVMMSSRTGAPISSGAAP